MAEAPTSLEDKATGQKRLENTEFVYKIAYGSVAFWLGKKADEYHSHRWTCYVRNPENKDMTHIVDKVVFKLHDSFPNPIRVLEKPPYELTETGWGEFEIGITIHFTEDSGEKPIEVFHPLKLYEDQVVHERQSTKKAVVMESYDEAVFSEPVEAFYNRVSAIDPPMAVPSDITPLLPTPNEAPELAKINAARRSVLQQIQYLSTDAGATAVGATPGS
mmetsp:Transcript_3127/g.6516  ORF Transcript_3127/g.6516 Transcript_3127/m.6516 type:complete len:218 (-) Transcript_3127:477-1130(-)|eukprot:CAMPEP_0118944632 /NCGR_PEP_ID=MMETSP1169-20130426/40682_1 /TAXON_ID=36882 /ORGANISM="Pyramimonas obovata, Strain CCMP722" /LENGTH=217 /DNA_ID=CAMNT_0006890157 /DNA_START=96 /DNA_END=749 /DNA_ORIENTATION=+